MSLGNKEIFRDVRFIGAFILLVLASSFYFYKTIQKNKEADAYLANPKVNDFFFIDYSKYGVETRPNERYRLARLVDITGEWYTVVYGNYFYSYPNKIEDSFRFEQVTNQRYFEKKRYEYSKNQLTAMKRNGKIVSVLRPQAGMLFGSDVTMKTDKLPRGVYFPGARENSAGEEFLSAINQSGNYQLAYDKFKESADKGFPKGQVNLGEMYLTGDHGEKSYEKALYWFEQAAIQSYKPGINKYLIVCNYVSLCIKENFYQTLADAGVNFRVGGKLFESEPVRLTKN